MSATTLIQFTEVTQREDVAAIFGAHVPDELVALVGVKVQQATLVGGPSIRNESFLYSVTKDEKDWIFGRYETDLPTLPDPTTAQRISRADATLDEVIAHLQATCDMMIQHATPRGETLAKFIH